MGEQNEQGFYIPGYSTGFHIINIWEEDEEAEDEETAVVLDDCDDYSFNDSDYFDNLDNNDDLDIDNSVSSYSVPVKHCDTSFPPNHPEFYCTDISDDDSVSLLCDTNIDPFYTDILDFADYNEDIEDYLFSLQSTFLTPSIQAEKSFSYYTPFSSEHFDESHSNKDSYNILDIIPIEYYSEETDIIHHPDLYEYEQSIVSKLLLHRGYRLAKDHVDVIERCCRIRNKYYDTSRANRRLRITTYEAMLVLFTTSIPQHVEQAFSIYDPYKW